MDFGRISILFHGLMAGFRNIQPTSPFRLRQCDTREIDQVECNADPIGICRNVDTALRTVRMCLDENLSGRQGTVREHRNRLIINSRSMTSDTPQDVPGGQHYATGL